MGGRMRRFLRLARRAGRAFRADESGSATLWNLFWLINFLILVGVAVDTTNAWRMRTMLQSTADAAAHAAAASMIQPGIARPVLDSRPELAGIDGDDPRQVARAVAGVNMPPEMHGQVLREEDVILGRWDSDERSFDPAALFPDAVKVTLRRNRIQENAVPTLLLRLGGFHQWDIEVDSIARFYKSDRARCVDPVLSAKARVDVQTNDVYVGICVHADVDVSLETGEPWLSDEVIGLVDRVVLSGATGVDLALLDGILGGGGLLGGGGGGLLGDLGDLLGEELTVAGFDELVADLRASADLVLDPDAFSRIVLTAGMTYYVECSENRPLPLPAGLDLTGVVLISECPVRAAQDLSLRASVVIANLRALRTIELDLSPILELPKLAPGPACVPGDGVQILVFADFDTAARFATFDPMVMPLGEALVAAHNQETEVDGDLLASVGVSLVGQLAANLGLDGLLGLCLGTEFMLHADAVTLAR